MLWEYSFYLHICVISIGFGSATGESPIVVVADQIVAPNQQFTINITIDFAVPITGAQFNLLFDNLIATVNSVTKGYLFIRDSASTIFNDGTINRTFRMFPLKYNMFCILLALGQNSLISPYMSNEK